MIRRFIARIAAISVPVLLLLGATTLHARAEKAEVLRFRHTASDKARYDFSLSSRVHATEESGEIVRAEIRIQMSCAAEFLKKAASGDWGVTGQILSGFMIVKSKGEEGRLDLGGLEEKYIVSPLGEIKERRHIAGQPPMLQYVGSNLVLGPLDAFLLGGAAMLPEKPLRRGDTWKGIALLPGISPGQTEQVPYESVLLGEERFRGTLCQKIKTSRTAVLEETIQSPDGPDEVHVKLKISGQDTWLFDPQRGLIMFSAGTHDVVVTTTITRNSQDIGSASATGVVNTRSVLTEFNGVKLSDQ